MGGVAIENGSVTGTDLTRVVEDNNLGGERVATLRGVVLGVTSNVTSSDILNGDVLDVEADVITGETSIGEDLVVHLDGLDLSGHVGGSEGDDHTGLDNTGLNSTDGHCADTTNLVDILEGKSERLVMGSRRGLNGINSLEEGLTLNLTGLGVLGPSLVPGAVGGGLNHVVTVPSGNGDEGDSLGVVTNLLDEVGGLLDNLVESVLGPLDGVHLVDSNNELLNTEGESEQGVLSGLTVLGDTSLELTNTTSNDEDGAISLRGTGNHVLDEISVTGGINNSDVELRGLELPEGDINGDTSLSLSLKLVKNPGVLERTLSKLISLLLELLDGSLIDTTALVDKMTGSGRLTGIDVTDDNEVNVSLFLSLLLVAVHVCFVGVVLAGVVGICCHVIKTNPPPPLVIVEFNPSNPSNCRCR